MVILFFITLYLYLVRKVECKNHFFQLVIWLSAIIVFYIPLALQNGVGTDYESYKSLYYMSVGDLELYLNKGEFIFIKIMELANYLGHP